MGIELFYPKDDAQAEKEKQETFSSENDPQSQTIDYLKQGLVAGTMSSAIHGGSSSYKKNSNQGILYNEKENTLRVIRVQLLASFDLLGRGALMKFRGELVNLDIYVGSK